MNYKKRKKALSLYSSIFSAIMGEPTNANFQIINNIATLEIDGSFSMLIIKFAGNVFINNILPDGYSIKVNQNTIIIRNIMLRKLNNELLFKFSGTFSPKSVTVITYSGNKFNANVFDKNKLELINLSKTNVEDDTLIISDEIDYTPERRPVNKIDDDTIRGLYTSTPFSDGYSGYYNFSPSEKIYMTGKKITNQSVPINKKKLTTNTQRKNLNKIYNKIRVNISKAGLSKESFDSKVIPIKKDVEKISGKESKISTPLDIRKVEQIKLGGKY